MNLEILENLEPIFRRAFAEKEPEFREFSYVAFRLPVYFAGHVDYEPEAGRKICQRTFFIETDSYIAYFRVAVDRKQKIVFWGPLFISQRGLR